MKTKIEGIMITNADMRKHVTEVVSSVLRNAFCRPFDAQQVKDAIEASYCAFHSASCSAGNGLSSTSQSKVGSFFALADITTGELELYFDVEEL